MDEESRIAALKFMLEFGSKEQDLPEEFSQFIIPQEMVDLIIENFQQSNDLIDSLKKSNLQNMGTRALLEEPEIDNITIFFYAVFEFFANFQDMDMNEALSNLLNHVSYHLKQFNSEIPSSVCNFLIESIIVYTDLSQTTYSDENIGTLLSIITQINNITLFQAQMFISSISFLLGKLDINKKYGIIGQIVLFFDKMYESQIYKELEWFKEYSNYLIKNLSSHQPIILQALSKLCSYSNSSSVVKAAGSAILILFNEISEQTESHVIQRNEEVHDQTNESNNLNPFDIKLELSNDDGISSITLANSNKAFKNYIKTETYKQTKIFLNGINNFPEKTKQSILSNSQIFREYSKSEEILTAVYILSKLRPKTVPIKIVNILVNNDVFAVGSSTFFNPGDDFAIFLRTQIIDFLCTVEPKSLYHAVSIIGVRPLVLSEFLFRYSLFVTQGRSSESVITQFINEDLYGWMFRSLSWFNQMIEKGLYEKQIRSARHDLVHFTCFILDKTERNPVCLQSAFFSSLLIFALTYEYFRKNVISNFAHILSSDNEMLVIECINFIISKIINFCRHSGGFVIGLSLIQCVNDVAKQNLDIASSCSILVSGAIEFIANYPSFETISEVINLIVLVFSSCSDTLSTPQMISIVTVFEKTFSDETEIERFDTSISLLLIGLISGNASQGTTMQFNIQRPELVPMVFSIFTAVGRTSVFLNNCKKLMNYSIYNRLILQEAGVDIIILDMFAKYGEDFLFNGFTIHNFKTEDELFEQKDVLSMILATRSSFAAAERIMRIMCPRDNTVSDLSKRFGSEIIPIIQIIRENPSIWWPLAIDQDYYEIHGSKKLSLKQSTLFSKTGATIGFWFYQDKEILEKIIKFQPDGTNFIANIFRLKPENSDNSIVEAYYKNGLIFLKIDCGDVKKEICLFPKIPSKEMVLIFISFQYDEVNKKLLLNGALKRKNGQKGVISNESIEYAHKNKTDAIITVGNQIKHFANRNDLLAVLQLGNFLVYPKLQQKYLNDFSNCDYNKIPIFYESDIEPLFCHVGGQSKLDSESLCNFAASIIPNISSFLLMDSSAQMLCPVFKGFDELTPDTRELFIDLIFHLCKESISSIINTIEFLLKQNNGIVFTKKLFLRFKGWLQIEEIETIVVERILFNFDIWITAPQNELTDISKEWTRLFTQGFYDIPNFFRNLVNNIRRYFYFEREPTELKKNMRFRSDDIDITKIRSNLDQIMKKYLDNLSEDDVSDVEFLIQSAMETSDRKQKVLFFDLACRYRRRLVNSENAVSSLLRIDLNQYPEIFVQVVLLLQYASGKNAYQNYGILSTHIKKSTLSKLKINHEIICECPDMFSLALRCAEYQDIETQLGILNTLLQMQGRKEDIFMLHERDLWMVWPIIFTVRTEDPRLAELGWQFIAHGLMKNCKVDDVMWAMELFDAIYLATGRSCLKIKYTVLQWLSSGRRDIFIPIFNTLFLNTTNTTYTHILNEMKKYSVFEEMMPISEVDIDKNKIQDFMELDTSNINICLMLNKADDNMLKNEIYRHLQRIEGTVKITKLMQNIIDYYKATDEERIRIIRRILEQNSEIDKMIRDYKKSVKDVVKRYNSLVACWRNYEVPKPELIDFMEETQKLLDASSDLYYRQYHNIMKEYVHNHSLFTRGMFTQHNTDMKRSFIVNSKFISNHIRRDCRQPISKQKESLELLNNSFSCKQIKVGKKPQDCIFGWNKPRFLEFRKWYKNRKIIFYNIRHIIRSGQRIEFYILGGRSILLEFPSEKKAIDAMNQMQILTLQNVIFFQNIDPLKYMQAVGLKKRWQNGHISNFEYLTYVNIFYGRTFNDLERPLIYPTLEGDSISNKPAEPEQPESIGAQFSALSNYRRLINGSSEELQSLLPPNKQKQSSCSYQEMIVFPEITGNSPKECMELYNRLQHIPKEEIYEWASKSFGFVDSGEVKPVENPSTKHHDVSEDVWERFDAPLSLEVTTEVVSLNASSAIQVQMPLGHLKKLGQKKLFRFSNLKLEKILNVFVGETSTDAVVHFVTPNSLVTCPLITTDFTLGHPIVRPFEGLISSAVLAQDDVVAFNVGTLDATVYNGATDKFDTYSLAVTQIDSVKYSKPLIAIASNIGLIYLLRPPEYRKMYATVIVNIDSITDFAVGGDHGILAVLTRDGYVTVYSLKDTKIVQSVFVSTRVLTAIAVTEMLGIIVVFDTEYIYLFTVNGTPIDKVELKTREATSVCTWTDYEGIDHIAYSAADGATYEFPVTSPQNKRLLGSVSHGLSFVNRMHSVATVNMSEGILTLHNVM